MAITPSDGGEKPPEGTAHQHSYTPEQERRSTEAFEAIVAMSVVSYEMGQLEFFEPEDETYIRHEVQRMLYEPQLPNGGDKERHVIARLQALARREGPSWEGYGRVHYALSQWQAVLPGNPRYAGKYYARHPISPKADKAGFDFFMQLKRDSEGAKQDERAWFAALMLKGTPEPVSNFRMDCLFLLRKSDGEVERLVQLSNINGETSRGVNHQGSDILDKHAFAAPEKFREWCLGRGNFAWGGNQKDLQKMHEDNANVAAYRVINQVESVGAFVVKRPAVAPAQKKEAAASDLPAGWKMQEVLWFFGDCVYGPGGKALQADADGIYWYEGEGYYPTLMGREAQFVQGRPNMRPTEGLMRKGDGAYEFKAGRTKSEEDILREFFVHVCTAFKDSVGGYEGWLAMGMILAYAAGPEIFAKYGLFPGLWVHGQASSGKTMFTEWLLHLQGFLMSAGMGLVSKTTTVVGMQQQLENYASMALWGDEYRQGKIAEDKESLIRDSYNRQQAVKWTIDGKPRQMNTTFTVSGESTSSDAALRSRFVHVQVSKARRVVEHLDWMQANKECFVVIWRALMERREEFVRLMARGLGDWLETTALTGMDQREKMVHGIGYASWLAACFLFESHPAEETREFKAFTVGHTKLTAADVVSETNINVFLQDLLTAFNADAVPTTCFRLESESLDCLKDWPNQGRWTSYKLYINPEQTVSAINIYLRKEGRTLSLRVKDLQAQLSKTEYWIPDVGTKRIGAKGAMANVRAWGLELDKLPAALGRQEVSDEVYTHWLRHRDQDGEDTDPRRGPFYAIVGKLQEKEREAAATRKREEDYAR